jgi:hypothetical protein
MSATGLIVRALELPMSCNPTRPISLPRCKSGTARERAVGQSISQDGLAGVYVVEISK